MGRIVVPDSVKKGLYYTFSKHPSSVYVGTIAVDPSTSDRLRSWGDSLRDLAKKPVLGYGVTGYRFMDAQYFRVLIETGMGGMMAHSVGSNTVIIVRIVEPFWFLAGIVISLPRLREMIVEEAKAWLDAERLLPKGASCWKRQREG